MMRRKLFLQWSLILSLTAVGAAIAGTLGWFGLVYRMDVTKLSFVIIAVFAAASCWCGVLSWRLDGGIEWIKTAENRKKYFKEIEDDAEHGWFAAGLCEKLGLTGTVFGLVIMLIGGFKGFQGTDPQSIQMLLERLSIGMSTAFLTTLVGVICSILLNLQYHRLAQALKKVKPCATSSDQ